MSPSLSRRHAAATLLAALLLTACAATPWWQQDLDAWVGASTSALLDAWGPPLRTVSEADGATVLVYERTRSLDPRIEQLADPGAPLDPGRPRQPRSPAPQGECTLFFEIRNDTVAAARHEGQACDVVPRDPTRRRSDPATGRTR
ncbi:hypothetical protein [Thioalkalivibrio sp. XN279]|uniref:hypothetical protein n=1 Tax=Thioalkalivibrio sp. XN279 TaxID=2714953 RepID=UPI00140D3220|nr:hypothetical protein [Thioalkalivibrio sp. XN279]NHA13879.1 hypothetical protein [Thioalkalivibrio sp. XN279]